MVPVLLVVLVNPVVPIVLVATIILKVLVALEIPVQFCSS